MIRGCGDFSTLRSNPKFGGFFPHEARNIFKAEPSRDAGPVWMFNRYGVTRTNLRDGRVVYIGGEHGDFYDSDFCIYNDLVVLTAAKQIEIYGYPTAIFPPTDFHTATLVKDRLFVVGCLGYKDVRRPGETPVHMVDLSSYAISAMEVSGDKPGWIYKHQQKNDVSGFPT